MAHILATDNRRLGTGGIQWLSLALLAALTSTGACSIDWNEAIPCETNDNCPTGLVCNAMIGRCQPGTADDVTEDPTDDTDDADATDAVEDPIVDPTPDPDTGDPATDPVAEPDAPSDTPVEVDDPVEEITEDVCIPSTEVCNGLDDDCDGIPDNGISCCPDDDNMVVISRNALTFCIDLYEASRPDAQGPPTPSPGTDESMATSRFGVIPWSGATQDTARQACVDAGKRLCTADEWAEGCGGPNGWLYPYDSTTYDPTLCNGGGTGFGQVRPTGAMSQCVSPDQPRDMSGNLEEWIDTTGVSRGGSYDDGSPTVGVTLRCSGSDETPNPTDPGPTVGFRCCSDLVDSSE